MTAKSKQEVKKHSSYSMLGKIPYNYPTVCMRGMKIYDFPEIIEEKTNFVCSGQSLWNNILETMATVEPEKQYKPVTQQEIDDFIAHAKEKLKTVNNPITREACRQIGLQVVRRMKARLK